MLKEVVAYIVEKFFSMTLPQFLHHQGLPPVEEWECKTIRDLTYYLAGATLSCPSHIAPFVEEALALLEVVEEAKEPTIYTAIADLVGEPFEGGTWAEFAKVMELHKVTPKTLKRLLQASPKVREKVFKELKGRLPQKS